MKFNYHAITSNNGISCIIAKDGDTWQSIANEMRMSLRKILTLNEAIEEVPIRKGDYIYLEKKATKGPAEMKDVGTKLLQVRPCTPLLKNMVFDLLLSIA